MTETATQERGLYKAPFEIEAPEKASQTLLSRIDVCPFSGALYIRHKGGPQSAEMARGSAFHEFAEKATNMLIEQNEPKMPPEVAKDLMQAILDERVDLNLPAAEQDACRTMAWQWGMATVLDLEAVVGVEQMLELELSGWTIRGKLDLTLIANNEGTVDDYKTSKAIASKEAYEEAWQPQFYALLFAEGVPEGETVPLGQGLNGVWTRELYPRYRREEDGQLVHRYAYHDRQRIHDFKRTVETQLRKLEHGIETGEWAAQQGSHCSTCAASALCPIPPHLRDVRVIGTQGDALEVADRIIAVDREQKADKASLKAWVDENTPIQRGDLVFDFYPQESESFRSSDLKEQVKEIVSEAGEDPVRFWRKSTSTRFDYRKAKEES